MNLVYYRIHTCDMVRSHSNKECNLRSLITGRGGYKAGGGYVNFYPYEKGGGAEKVLG